MKLIKPSAYSFPELLSLQNKNSRSNSDLRLLSVTLQTLFSFILQDLPHHKWGSRLPREKTDTFIKARCTYGTLNENVVCLNLVISLFEQGRLYKALLPGG